VADPLATITRTVAMRMACPEWPDCADDEGSCLACTEAAAVIAALERGARVEDLLRGWPDKLLVAADWLDLLDLSLDALQESASAALRARWEAARGPIGDDHDEIQRDLRGFAERIQRETGQPQPAGEVSRA